MKEVFRGPNTARIGFYQSLLDDAGIPYFVQNSTIQQALVAGVLIAFFPLPEFWPALCVLNDEDYPEAMELLLAASSDQPTDQHDWKCAACGEIVPANFTSCWNCQAEAPIHP